MKRSCIAIIVFLSFVLGGWPMLLAAPSQSPQYGGTLKMIQDSSPRSPGGWIWELFANDSAVPQLIYEPLLRGKPDGRLEPWLAEDYKVADDYLSITFKLRKGIQFQDGSELNAEVAKWCLDNSIATKRTPYWKSVDIIDDYTVRLNLTEWRNTILLQLGDSVYTWMVSYKAFKEKGEDWLRMNPVGTGPFKFKSFQADSNYKVVRNDNYWKKDAEGNQLPYLDGIDTLFATELTTRVALVQSGQADVMAYEPGKTAADLEALGLRLNGNINSNFMIRFDTANKNSPFANKMVREAVAYAIDNETIAEGFSYGYWKAPYQIASQDSGAAYDPDYVGRRYNPDKAKQLMKDAGYADGFSCSMMVAPQGVDRDLIVAVQNYLSQIGIIVDLDFPDIAKHFSTIMKPLKPGTLIFEAFGKMGASWNAGFAFGMSYENDFYKSWEKTPAYIALYDASMKSAAEETKLVKAILKYIQDECTATPVAGGGKGWAEQPYVRDAGWNQRSWLPWWTFERCWLDKKK